MNPIVSEVTYGNVKGVSKDLVKEVLRELLIEEPGLFEAILQKMKSELQESIAYTNMDLAIERKRIADIELLLGLDNAVKDPNDPYYSEKRKRLDELQKKSGFLLDCKTPNENAEDRLYKELQLRGFMKTRDVMNYLGLKHNQQARRVMKKISDTHKDVVLDPNEHGKGHRIRFLRTKK